MATIEKPTELMTDLDYAIHLMMTGGKDPEFAAQVRAKAERITAEIREKHGLLNVAVDLIREVRDES